MTWKGMDGVLQFWIKNIYRTFKFTNVCYKVNLFASFIANKKYRWKLSKCKKQTLLTCNARPSVQQRGWLRVFYRQLRGLSAETPRGRY